MKSRIGGNPLVSSLFVSSRCFSFLSERCPWSGAVTLLRSLCRPADERLAVTPAIGKH
jgi:hypothetical protein